VIPVGGELVFSTPKTKKGVRQVSLDLGTIAVLRAHRKRQAERQLAAGSAWLETGRVFTREDGSHLHPDVLSKRFDAWVRRAGLTRITFHGLRHTWATMAMEEGIHTEVVSERLGHANISVTLDIYSKVRPAMDAHRGVPRVPRLTRRPDPVACRRTAGGVRQRARSQLAECRRWGVRQRSPHRPTLHRLRRQRWSRAATLFRR